jgi:hypothetical protein
MARLVWLELRHNAMPVILPVIALLFWFDSYRPSTTQSPIWGLTTFWNMGQGHTIIDFGPFVAGVAAWMGSRDGRRAMGDLVTATARPRWAGQFATWAATAIWAVGAYLVFVGVMFGVYIHQGVQGTPPWWWVAVGAVAVAAFSAAGFAVGVFFPSRFAAPLAAFGGFLAMMMSSQTGFADVSGWAQVLPTNSNSNFQPVSGIFYPWLPDLPIARIMFMAGIVLVALGLIGLPARAAGPALRRAAAVITVAGVAAAGTAAGLASTARMEHNGMVIPALHDAASDQPIRYTPVCGHADGAAVCLNPAYRSFLNDTTTALGPFFGEVAGLPGAPVRASQVASAYTVGEGQGTSAFTLSGQPPVLGMPLGALSLPGTSAFATFKTSGADFGDQLRLLAVHVLVVPGASSAGTPAQQAVQAVLLRGAGVPFSAQPAALGSADVPWTSPGSGPPGSGPPSSGPRGSGPPSQGSAGSSFYTAARRFAALPAATQHAWLVAHLAAVRSGQLTLAQLP